MMNWMEMKKMKIKSKPIGEWTIKEFLNYCRNNSLDEYKIIEADLDKRIEIEISDKDYELLKMAKRIFELSGINPNIVKIKSFGHANGKSRVAYEYEKNVNTILNEALFGIELPVGELSFFDLVEDSANE